MRQRTRIAITVLSAAGLFAMAGWTHAAPGGPRGEINQIEQQVTNLEGQVQNLQSDDSTLEGQLRAVQNSDSNLEGQVAALQAEVQTIQSNGATLSSTLTAAISALSTQISQLQATLGGIAKPGPTLWTYYDTAEPFTACGTTSVGPAGCNVGGNGDNIIRLTNPNGSPNLGLAAPAVPHTVCAMIYVFDDAQEMGECCGCPISSAQLATISVEQNLTNNWSIAGGPVGGEHNNGAIAIIATAQNAPTGSSNNSNGCLTDQNPACNQGCDPTNVPGYSVSNANNLLGTITHNQQVAATPAPGITMGLTEVNLSDDGPGDPTNLFYLQAQCGAIVGNGTGAGICNCPVFE